MNTKVSIVVPIYKIPIYALETCVNSLKDQEYNNCEIILVDDGSPDNCGQICDSYAQKDKRIKVIHKQNAGVSEARNTGIKESTGDFIMFVDGDDCLHPKAVLMMVVIALQNELDIVLCDYNRFYSKNPDFKTIQNQDHDLRIYSDKTSNVALRRKCLHEDNVYNIRFNGAPWGKMFSIKLIRDSKVLFDSSLVRSQDNHFNFIVFGKATRIGFINEKLYYYRQLPGSSVNRYRSNLFDISDLYIERISDSINQTSTPSDYSTTLIYVKIEKMLELLSNYSRSPKDDKDNALLYVKKAHKKWLSSLSAVQVFKLELNWLEKIRIVGLILKLYKLSLCFSLALHSVKMKLNNYRN